MPAIETAFNIAETHDATLHVLYVVEPPSVASDGDRFAGLDSLIEKLEQNGHRVTEAVAARAKESNIEATTAVRRGIPRDEILTYAPEHDIDLIVLGTHGRTGVKRTLLGSVTEAIVRHADIPVLTVHRDPAE
ncbi:universal stress protein [Haladaptatus sp. NG-SE-30]